MQVNDIKKKSYYYKDEDGRINTVSGVDEIPEEHLALGAKECSSKEWIVYTTILRNPDVKLYLDNDGVFSTRQVKIKRPYVQFDENNQFVGFDFQEFILVDDEYVAKTALPANAIEITDTEYFNYLADLKNGVKTLVLDEDKKIQVADKYIPDEQEDVQSTVIPE